MKLNLKLITVLLSLLFMAMIFQSCVPGNYASKKSGKGCPATYGQSGY